MTGISELQNGVSAHEIVGGGEVVTAVKEDSTLQIATVLNDETAPERFDYPIDLPEGARIELVNGQPFVWAADGSMIGGFFPPGPSTQRARASRPAMSSQEMS